MKRLTQACDKHGAQAALILDSAGMRYFSGFTGEGCLVVSADKQVLITDSRYTEVAQKQAPLYDVRDFGAGKYHKAIAQAARDAGGAKLLVEGENISHHDYEAIKKADAELELISVSGLGAQLRIKKDAGEIALMKKAAQITDQCLEYALSISKPGMTELELAAELYYYLATRHQSEKAFPFIVASGVNGSMPHAEPGENRFAPGDMVTLDFGAEYMGYKSDMTRTYSIGRPGEKMREIYGIVLEAQTAAEESLKPGMKCADVDAVARDIITGAGYGDNFGHGLGHGVGLLIHESPRLSRYSEDILEPGMMVTVEPGIYLPGVGGVRIENTCLITENGYETLFKADKKMVIL
ncbi:MAG: Xaa-Pro peptidase family protein [Eubacteriales bacterium]|nr:Xaa-Pro peptidase family protein [Eubacteriales bacterium]